MEEDPPFFRERSPGTESEIPIDNDEAFGIR